MRGRSSRSAATTPTSPSSDPVGSTDRMPSVVVDDATLLSILTGRSSAVLAETVRAGEVSTTASWYYRLHRALHDPASAGPLSAIVANLSVEARAVLFRLLDDLPAEIVVPGPRLVVPVMGALRL